MHIIHIEHILIHFNHFCKQITMKTVKERLIEFLKQKGIGQAKFAETVGLSRGFVNSISQSIQPKTLDRISIHYPELNRGWLLTGEGFVVVLMDDAKAILDRYGWNMNLMTNQQYNMRLKILADAAKIDKNITSHWFRRSAGMYYLNHGMPIEVVSRILGHASIKTTQKAYAKILNKTVTDAFGKMLENKKKNVKS